jgi:MFS family permease
MVLAALLAFAFTFVNVVARSTVNERIPRDMQGRIFAAQSVLTNLASIPPILLTGALADVFGVTPVFFFVGVGAGIGALFFAARNLASPMKAPRVAR